MCSLMVWFTMWSRPVWWPWPLLVSILSLTSSSWLDHVANSGENQKEKKCFHNPLISKAVSCCPGWWSPWWSCSQLQSQQQFSSPCSASTCTLRWIEARKSWHPSLYSLLQGILLASILVTAVPATFLLVSLIMWFIVLAAYNTNNKKQEVEVRHVHLFRVIHTGSPSKWV